MFIQFVRYRRYKNMADKLVSGAKIQGMDANDINQMRAALNGKI